MRRKGELGMACVIGYKRGSDDLCYHAIDMDEHGKSKLALMVSLSLRSLGCDRYAFICEMWVSEKARELGVQPKDAPDVRDGLQISACDAAAAVCKTYLVEGKGKAQRLTVHHEMDSRRPDCRVGGRWLTLLAPNFDPNGGVYFSGGGGRA
jgi:hypothetical protein